MSDTTATEAARSSSAGSWSGLGSVLGIIFVTLLPIVIRLAMESFGGVFLASQTVLNLIHNLS